jgi:hypothetical protein
MPNASAEVEAIITSFVERIIATVEGQTVERMQRAVLVAFPRYAASPMPISRAHETSPAAEPSSKKPRKLNLTPKGLAARKLQGKYMSILRALPAAKRERVKRVAHEKGVAGAIHFAASLKT